MPSKRKGHGEAISRTTRINQIICAAMIKLLPSTLSMCPRQKTPESKDVLQDDKRYVPALVPPRPPSLQFISVGLGGKVSNLRSVRAHVSKEYHQRKKEKKGAHLSKLEQQKKSHLRPNRRSTDSTAANLPEPETDSDEESSIKNMQVETGRGILRLVPQKSRKMPLPPTVYCPQSNCEDNYIH
jgi:hypothetical protein